MTRQLDRAVAEVLAVMLHLACIPEPLAIHPEPAAFTASVLLSGSLDGICTLAFNQPAAAQLTSSLIGIPPDDISLDLCADTAGELCNMIAGSWKSAQSHTHDLCHISCPIVGISEPPQPSPFRETITRLYRFAGGHFSLTLSFN
jgi:chemotaxis protein CheX